MATFKKTASKKTSSKTSSGPRSGAGGSAPEQGERLAKSLSESAQQIWLAGVGAFGRAQVEGTKLFEGLVKEGLNLEQSARKFAGGQAEVVRDVVESGVGTARERAADTWDRLEKVFEDRVQRALVKLGVPGRDDLKDLSARVDGLTAELRRQKAAKASAAAATRGAGGSPARSTRATTGSAAPKKATKKAVARKSARKAAKTSA
ncbi:MAG: phasin family protein [Pseudomonadota bacterium]|nr:phasin family protein [Pseudomonadota bacterium]